jgi:hypothetical protein
MSVQQPLGFFALWLNKDSEYHAGPEEERETGARIQQAFVNGQSRGIRMYGRYGSRWSGERQYFTFWTSPNFEALQATIDDLEKAGDFKFADSEHIIGSRLPDPDMTDDASLELNGPDEACPFGFFALWRQTGAYYHGTPEEWESSNRAVRDVFNRARGMGVRMFGRYDCRWSSAWDYFTFWLAPSFEVVQQIMEELDPAADWKFADSRHIFGILEPQFRFATHLQPASD